MSTIVDGQAGITFSDSSNQPTAGYTGFRNRIINGAMQIDQRNNGASQSYGSTGSTYCLDRFFLGNSQASKITSQQNAGSITPPPGLQSYIGMTVASAYTITSADTFYISQAIEAYNIADFAWGTANARSITFSFWVYSSITGLFGGAVINSGAISPRRTYCFSYTIPSANTWTYVTITIPGDTTGTWYQNNNGVGMYVVLSYGMGSANSITGGSFQSSNALSVTGATSILGTLGAVFYTTGWQIEKAGAATPFEIRQYGTELALCQRYYYRHTSSGTYTQFGVGVCGSSTNILVNVPLPVTMRVPPTSIDTAAAGNFVVYDGAANTALTSIVLNFVGQNSAGIVGNVASGLTQTRPAMLEANGSSSAYIGFTAEL